MNYLSTQQTLKLEIETAAQVTLYDQYGRYVQRLEGDSLPDLLAQAREMARTRPLTAYPVIRA
jgi:hypothetical protein